MLGSLFTPDMFPSWRIQSADGLWHRVASYIFHYTQAENDNTTFCGLHLINPPFWQGHWWYQLSPGVYGVEPPPEPACEYCEIERRVRVRDWHLGQARALE